MSCIGNGYLSGNILIPFPFEDGQSIQWSSTESDPEYRIGDELEADAMYEIQKCFVDAMVSVNGECIDEWPSIGMVSVRDRVLSFTISANGTEERVSVSSGPMKFPIISGTSGFGHYVIVVSSEGIAGFEEFCSANNIFPTIPPAQDFSSSTGREGNFFLRLCTKCITLSNAGLSSIKVYDGVSSMASGPHFTLRGDVSIVSGNNMSLSGPDDDESGIELNATPGSGLGVVSCGCNGRAVVESPIKSPDGHTRIFNDTCYDFEPGEIGIITVDGQPRTSRQLIIHSKCTACCTCDMFASIVNDRLSPLSDDIRGAKSTIESLLSEYEEGVGAFNKRISTPRLSDIGISMTGMPVSEKLSSNTGTNKIKGKMGRCAFNAILRNSSFEKLVARISSISGTDRVVEATAAWTDSDGNPKTRTANAGNGLGGTFVIYPGRSLVVTFVSVKDTLVNKVGEWRYTGSIKFDVSRRRSDGSSVLIGTISKSVEV